MPRILNTPLVPIPKPLAAAALALAVLGLAGCVMQPDVAMSVTTADGQKIEVPFSGPPTPTTDGVVTVLQIQFAPWDVDQQQHKATTLAFSFLIQFKPGSEPANILIEDDTEPPILTIFESANPKIVKNNLWAGLSRPFSPSDEHVNWVLNLDNSVRVYRVTVKLKDGTTHVLLKPVIVPAPMKSFMQKRLETAPPPKEVNP
jgi:hypothetical protein